MSIKKICAFMLSVAVVGGSSIAVYASQKSDASTKNVVVITNNQQVTKVNESKGNTGNAENDVMSDEKAVQMASKVMKDYMGMDLSYYSQTRVDRDMGKDNPHIINVVFTPADGTHGSNFVEIDETTGKVINVTAINNLSLSYSGKVEIDETTGNITNVTPINNLTPSYSSKVDDTKVKEASINFLKKIGQDADVDLNSIVIRNDNGSLSYVDIQLKDQSHKVKGGAKIGLEVSLQNYVVMHYQNDSCIYNR